MCLPQTYNKLLIDLETLKLTRTHFSFPDGPAQLVGSSASSSGPVLFCYQALLPPLVPSSSLARSRPPPDPPDHLSPPLHSTGTNIVSWSHRSTIVFGVASEFRTFGSTSTFQAQDLTAP